ncbi:hypothetical protein QZH41_017256 [Actinostola sp. cb2023]|nr:hypothetical protein QZH41_017256 [Actinostola sp. cb2023]
MWMATWPSVLIARDTCDKRLFVCVNMAYGGDERVRNPEWEDDETLKADLAKYVMQNLSRREMVDFETLACIISNHLRLDKGTETGHMATIHAFLRQYESEEDDDTAEETVHYGPSTSNKIERWWRELHHRLEKYFKRQLLMLLEQGHYEPDNQTDRDTLAFVFIPVIGKEMDVFCKTIWNSHRVRSQKEAQMPKGIPNHLYSFPAEYGAEECGFPVSKEALDEVAQLSDVMSVGDDYLTPAVRAECERIIPEIDDVKPNDAATTYLFLKTHYQEPSAQ